MKGTLCIDGLQCTVRKVSCMGVAITEQYAGAGLMAGGSTSVGLGISVAEGRSWIGSHEFDYGYYNGLGKRNNKKKESYGGEPGMEPWKSGDVFQVELNLGRKPGHEKGHGVDGHGHGTLKFWRNGMDLGEAFTNVDCSQERLPFYPTFSFDTKAQTFILVDGCILHDTIEKWARDKRDATIENLAVPRAVSM